MDDVREMQHPVEHRGGDGHIAGEALSHWTKPRLLERISLPCTKRLATLWENRLAGPV
jgi:hypothetical protein